MDKLDDYLRIQEAAEFLGVSPNTLRNWGREEKVPEFRHPVNNYRLYRRSDLEALLRRATRSRRTGGRQKARR
jgi:DNA (cytosine-5)-methyltransferase 1